MGLRTKCRIIQHVGGRITSASHLNIVNGVNTFNNVFSLSTLGIGRPILIDNASNINAGLGLTFRVSGRSAVNISTITVYIGSILTRNTRPLIFLSCITINRGRPGGVRTVIDNITRNYHRTNYTLINNRATRVPNVCTRNRCSVTNFAINIIRGSGLVSNSGIGTNSILINVTSDNIRSGNFDLIHGVITSGYFSLRRMCPRLSGGLLNRILLAPAGVCIQRILRIVHGYSMRNVDRVANNKFSRGVPHVLRSKRKLRVSRNT